MKGKITEYDLMTGGGCVKTPDGLEYPFVLRCFRHGRPPCVGMEVEFQVGAIDLKVVGAKEDEESERPMIPEGE